MEIAISSLPRHVRFYLADLYCSLELYPQSPHKLVPRDEPLNSKGICRPPIAESDTLLPVIMQLLSLPHMYARSNLRMGDIGSKCVSGLRVPSTPSETYRKPLLRHSLSGSLISATVGGHLRVGGSPDLQRPRWLNHGV